MILIIIESQQARILKLKINQDELLRFVDISSGNNHCMAVDSENRLYCWGSNSYGQILQPITTKANQNPKNVQIEQKVGEYMLKHNEQMLFRSKYNKNSGVYSIDKQERIDKQIKKVNCIKAGYNNTMIIVNDEIYVKGSNNRGCLSLKDHMDCVNQIHKVEGLNRIRIVGLSSGITHSLVWDQNG